MKTLILAATALSFTFSLDVPAYAGVGHDGIYSIDQMSDGSIDKRRKPRIKGGSGCDDPGDVLEHPACR